MAPVAVSYNISSRLTQRFPPIVAASTQLITASRNRHREDMNQSPLQTGEDTQPDGRPNAVANWLLFVACLVFTMVVVGGITRLTESGLSITEWKPVTGALPPIGQAEWLAEFEKYKATPEYNQINAGMTLAQFQFIYFWEWAHRLIGAAGRGSFCTAVFMVRGEARHPQRLLCPRDSIIPARRPSRRHRLVDGGFGTIGAHQTSVISGWQRICCWRYSYWRR